MKQKTIMQVTDLAQDLKVCIATYGKICTSYDLWQMLLRKKLTIISKIRKKEINNSSEIASKRDPKVYIDIRIHKR